MGYILGLGNLANQVEVKVNIDHPHKFTCLKRATHSICSQRHLFNCAIELGTERNQEFLTLILKPPKYFLSGVKTNIRIRIQVAIFRSFLSLVRFRVYNGL